MNRICLIISSMSLVAVADAHHSAAPHFDLEQEVSLQGVITELKFVNPHAYFYFDVSDEVGTTVNWRCEISAATGLKRLGWTAESLLPGQSVIVNAAPARRENNVCYMNFLTFDDGTRIVRNGSPPRASDLAENIEELATIAPRPDYLANGQPNLGGLWLSQGMGGGMGGGMGPGGPLGLPAPTAAGTAASAGYEQPFDDPAIFCHPANIIFGWTHDRHVNEIYQTDLTVMLQYGYMDLIRAIHLDQSDHSESIARSVGGHSIGRWEENELVVDTIGFEQGILFPLNGRMHSDQMQVIERFRVVDDGQTLIRSYVAHDPVFLQTDWIGENVMQRTSEPHVPYDCTELSGDNNRRSGD